MIEQGKVLQQRYRIDKQIGQGGMGAVYVAMDERFGSTVAIKETLCMDDNYRKALEREARLLNSLKHSALPRVSDHFIEDNGQFLVMEYIPGNDLAFILEETEKPFPFERVRKWADQLLDALEFLHTQSLPVIHRDIKPQNLKLTVKDQIVLLDFGLAKGNPTDAGFQTAAKSIFGYSRNYASLEQIQGTGTDPRSDLYSLAATLYHLSTGQAPEDALTRAMTVLSGQADPLVPANVLNGDVPAGFAGVLQKALNLNAASRPGSASEMREMLAEYDSYGHLAVGGGVATAAAVADLGAEKTQLMPGVTKQGIDRSTGVKTEVLPVYVSQETAVKTSGNGHAADSVPQRPTPARQKFVAVAASVAVLTTAIGAAAYFYEPGFLSSPEPSTPQADAPASQPSPAIGASAEAQKDPSTDEAAAGTAPAPKDEPARAETETPASRQTSKAAKTGTSRRSDVNATGDPNDFDLDGKTVYVGNMKIKNGRVETPDSYIDENGVTPKAPTVPRIGPDGMPDMRYLSPAQRRKINQLRRRGLLQPVKPSQPYNNKY